MLDDVYFVMERFMVEGNGKKVMNHGTAPYLDGKRYGIELGIKKGQKFLEEGGRAFPEANNIINLPEPGYQVLETRKKTGYSRTDPWKSSKWWTREEIAN